MKVYPYSPARKIYVDILFNTFIVIFLDWYITLKSASGISREASILTDSSWLEIVWSRTTYGYFYQILLQSKTAFRIVYLSERYSPLVH